MKSRSERVLGFKRELEEIREEIYNESSPARAEELLQRAEKLFGNIKVYLDF